MTISDRLVRIAAWVFGVLLVVGAIGVAWKYKSYEKELLNLRNQVATHENTIEVKEGLYTKKATEFENLQKLLDESKAEQSKLKIELDKNKAEILGLTEFTVKLKKDYEAKLAAKQTEVPGVDGKPGRTKVEFEKEFGPYKISGFTLTNPGEASLKLAQHRPLRLSLALTQLPDKSWRTYIGSSETDLSVDVQLTSVNPYLLSRKWYERIGVVAYVGGGNVGDLGAASIIGVGATIDVHKFSVGPAFWLTTHLDKFYGVSFTWRPFMRK